MLRNRGAEVSRRPGVRRARQYRRRSEPLKSSVDHNVKKVIFISTGGALYGEPDVVPADEGHPVRPLSPYGTSKFSFEQYLGTFKRTFGSSSQCCATPTFTVLARNFYAEEGRVGGHLSRAGCWRESRSPSTATASSSRDMLHVGDAATANWPPSSVATAGFFMSAPACRVGQRVFRKLAKPHRLQAGAQPGLGAKATSTESPRNARARRRLLWEPRVGLEEGLSLDGATISASRSHRLGHERRKPHRHP